MPFAGRAHPVPVASALLAGIMLGAATSEGLLRGLAGLWLSWVRPAFLELYWSGLAFCG